MSEIYDIAIIGAGIAGCMVANEAKARGLKVIIIDKASKAATGGSGAAGAFISPKLGKETPLLNLTNEAFNYAVDFYSKNYSQHFIQSGILRVPKNKLDEDNFYHYMDILRINSVIYKEQDLKKIGLKNEKIGLFFETGGVCDAQMLCNSLINNIKYKIQNVSHIEQRCEYLTINNNIKAKKIVFATGFEGYKKLFDYMGINGVWGSRGDFYSDSKLNISIHKNSSISCVKNSIIKLGATHLRAKNSTDACLKCDGKPLKELIEKSQQLLELKNLKLKETFCGMRAGSKDYAPLVGKIIDTKFMLQEYPQLKKGYNKAPLKHIDNLYILNGLGGRGFVLAPLMAKWLIDLIVENKPIRNIVNPDRLFLKWVRRLY